MAKTTVPSKTCFRGDPSLGRRKGRPPGRTQPLRKSLTLFPGWAVFLLLFALSGPVHPQTPLPPFFLMGDGCLHLIEVKTGQEARVDLRLPDGSINETALTEVDRVFGFIPQWEGDHISLRLLFMMDYFSDLVAPGKPIFLTSGYRSPEYNAALRKAGGNVARTSTHMDGLAADFYIEGVEGKDLWEIIRRARCCGVGHYGGKEIHLDAARPRFWEAATSGTGGSESEYNRRVVLTTDRDRYRSGERLRLALASVSHFGFGVRSQAVLAADGEGLTEVRPIPIAVPAGPECLPILDRAASRRLELILPADLPVGRYRLRLDFCQRPFEEMPKQVFSNPIEVSNGS